MIDKTFYVIIADASKWMKTNDADTKNHISRQTNKYNKILDGGLEQNP